MLNTITQIQKVKLDDNDHGDDFMLDPENEEEIDPFLINTLEDIEEMGRLTSEICI